MPSLCGVVSSLSPSLFSSPPARGKQTASPGATATGPTPYTRTPLKEMTFRNDLRQFRAIIPQ